MNTKNQTLVIIFSLACFSLLGIEIKANTLEETRETRIMEEQVGEKLMSNKKQEQIHPLISSISGLAYHISNETKTDVFTDYFGHTQSFRVSWHIEGWASEEAENPTKTFNVSLEEKNSLEELNIILQELRSVYRRALMEDEIGGDLE